MAKVQQSDIMQSQKPYILTMPNISRGMHSYSVAEWGRRGPSLFGDDESNLQYLTMIGNRDGTLLLTQQDSWDDGQRRIVLKETLESHHRDGPASRRVRKKKISLTEYSKKRVSSDGRRSAGEPEGAGARRIKKNEILLTKATCCYKDDEASASPANCQEGYIESNKLLMPDKTPERAPGCGVSLPARVGSKLSTRGNGTQDKESSGKKRGQKRRIEAIIEPEDAGKTRQESGSPPAKKIRASPKLNSTAQEVTSSLRGCTARGDKISREPSGSDAVSVPITKPSMRKGGAAILPLPPTKDTRVRQSMRGVAVTKPRALSESSARPQVSIIPTGAQAYPSWVCREHLEWIEQEVARRVAVAVALSKDENAPTASAGAPYKDASTQVDAVIPTAKASRAGHDCVLIEKKKKDQTVVNKPRDKPIIIQGADKELSSTKASEQAVPYIFERKAAKKSTEQAIQQQQQQQQQQHVEEEPRNCRPLQLFKNQHRHELKSNNNDGRPQPPKNQNNPPVDPKKRASKKVQNTTSPAATTEIRASAAALKAIINPTKNQAAFKQRSKNILRTKVPNWFQMLQPPPSKKQY